MDEISITNRARWNALSKARVPYAQPLLTLNPKSALALIDPHGFMGQLADKQVLCLASGGGQQSAAFGILGANVTVFDLSDEQLDRDRQAADHYGHPIQLEQGDMRDLSRFQDSQFEVIWQPYSINFVPSVHAVFQGVNRVLKTGGIYYLQFANPFTMTVDVDLWDGDHYPLKHPYLDGFDITQYFPHWDVKTAEGWEKYDSPTEYRHKLSTILNELVTRGFEILGFWEESSPEENPEPGSWNHFIAVAPPYFTVWCRKNR